MWPIELTRNEEKVASTILSNGSQDAQTLARLTGLQRRVVYDTLQKLVQSGLVTQSMQNNKTYFSLALESYLAALKVKQQLAETELAKIIEQQKKVVPTDSQKTNAQLYFGISAVKQVLLAQVSSGKDYLTLGAPLISLTCLGEYFWKNYNLKQAELKITARIIFNSSLEMWAPEIRHPNKQIRFLKEGIEPMTQTFVYGNTTIIIVWSDAPVATVIEDTHVANSYRMFFDLLWQDAKKMKTAK